MTILTLNSGSSSVKFALYGSAREKEREVAICAGEIEGLRNVARFVAKAQNDATLIDKSLGTAFSHEAALDVLFKWLDDHCGQQRLEAVGHRVVHGGSEFIVPVLVDAAALVQLSKLIPLAPLHQPHNLAAISAISKMHPSLPQVACFDTAFHHTQTLMATAFAIPRSLSNEGIKRYGFHGLSYEYIAGVLPSVLGPETAEGRVMVAHLGSGASMCAMHRRKSVATTMGFTALDGLVMGRRCGAIDPGVLLYLLQFKNMCAEEVSELLYKQSGLLGVSGLSDDMRDLLASSESSARQAIDLFVYRITQELGSLAAVLGGIDALVFTAGIGEHAPEIRARVCKAAGWLGITLDEGANTRGEGCISNSRISVWIVPTDEQLMIARHTRSLI